MLVNIEKHWYQKKLTWLTFILLPFSWLFLLITTLRRLCYRFGLKKTFHFNVPVIVVGNITVGGTGKTPFVIWLAKYLKTQGYRPGIVSRGAGGSLPQAVKLVHPEDNPTIVGDEALLLARNCQCPVVISKNRVLAVQTLLAETDCNIVITDDGLQHYRLGRSMEIAIIDLNREFGNGSLLPAGPLRELPSRLQSVDCIVRHGKRGDMQLQSDLIFSLREKKSITIGSLANQTVHAVAGIGHPERFFSTLRQHGLNIIEHAYPDHYHYQAKDLIFPGDEMVIMTEKDAVKLDASSIDHRFWYLPVNAIISDNLENSIKEKVKTIKSTAQ